jgi:imidazole glycerol-phosphate synthase subunit HisH
VSALVIVDSGVANLGSVRAALVRLGVEGKVTQDAAEIAAASRVLLPGVGAYDAAMQTLRARGLVEVLRTLRQPLLGICLGMQLLYDGSEEGTEAGLGRLPGTIRKLVARPGVRVPHMGWNTIEPARPSPLTDGLSDGEHAYFVHSYAAEIDEHTLAASTHGTSFAAIVGRGNVYGAQFHPERSSSVGARLLENFLALPA